MTRKVVVKNLKYIRRTIKKSKSKFWEDKDQLLEALDKAISDVEFSDAGTYFACDISDSTDYGINGGGF